MSYFEDLSAERKAELQREFESKNTTKERRIELLTYLQEAADEAEMSRPCPRCKHRPFFAPHHEALIEGHVYSHEGMREVGITHYCEFCFDLVTVEPDEEDEDAWKQRAIAEDLGALADSMGPGTTVRHLSDEEARALFADEPNID